jgi:hypothetical protein
VPCREAADYPDHHAYIIRVMDLLRKTKLDWLIACLEMAFDTEDKN